MENRRLDFIDYMKGFAIFLMVYGHSGAPFVNYVYLFHMPVFFVVTGYLWKDYQDMTISDVRRYLFKKIKTLYIPYIFANILYTVLNNSFIRWGIYSDNYDFVTNMGGDYTVIHELFSIPTLAKNILSCLLFAGETELGGATWFLRTMFVSCIIILVQCYCISRLGNTRIQKLCWIIFDIMIIFLASYVSSMSISLPRGLHTVFASLICIRMGMLLKRTGYLYKLHNKKTIVFLLLFIYIVVAGKYGSVSMARGYITNIVFFCSVVLAGFTMLYVLEDLSSRYIKKFFYYLGKHTMSIIIFHFLAFKVVTFIYLQAFDKDKLLLAKFPVVEDGLLWFFYIVAGITIPLLIDFSYKQVLKVYRKKMSNLFKLREKKEKK